MFPLISKILVFSSVYILGRLGYSAGWILPFFVSMIYDHTKSDRELKRNLKFDQTVNEKDLVLSRLEDIPAWVLFPDIERAEWINTILRLMWPKMKELLENSLMEVEQKIKNKSPVTNFKFAKIDLGNKPPKITGIKTYEANIQKDDIVIDVSLSFLSDSELRFSVSGIEGGISHIQFEGTTRITLQLGPEVPFVEGLEITFLAYPTFDYSLLTLLAPLDMFIVRDFIRAFIREQLLGQVVYPNKMFVRLKEKTSVRFTKKLLPHVEAIVRSEIKFLDNFGDFCGQNACVVVEFGVQMYASVEVKIEDGAAAMNFSCDFIRFDGVEEELNVLVIIRDAMGTCQTFSRNFIINNLKDIGSIEGNFPLNPGGSAFVTLTWITLHSDRKELQNVPGKNSALLEVFIDSARHLPDDVQKIFVEVSVGNQIQTSTIVNVSSSSWEENFQFLLFDAHSGALTVKIVDHQTSKELGLYVYNISDLAARPRMEHRQQSFPLLRTGHNIEILMALKILAFKTLNKTPF